MKVREVTDRMHNMAKIVLSERDNGVVAEGPNAYCRTTWNDREVVWMRVCGDALLIEFE